MENPNQRRKLRHERKRPMGGVQQSLAHAKAVRWRRQRVLPEEKLEELAAVSRILAAPPTDAWERYPKDASQPCHPSPTA